MVPLLIGAAVIAAGWGTKKGIDAKKDYSDAHEYNNRAKDIYETASDALSYSRSITNSSLEELGITKLTIYNKSISKFISIFEQIKNINLTDLNIDELSIETSHEILQMKNIAISMSEIAGSGVASLGAGALAGLGAYGGAMTFGAASTGTAIGTLSGAAATNATLAWFGGGSLASGGLGMAGGTMILGGLVAGPVLMVAGMVAAAKAEKARADAYSNYLEAKAAAESMTAAKKTSDIIGLMANEINERLIELNVCFKSVISLLNVVVSSSKDYQTYNENKKNIVRNSVAFAITIKNIMDFSIFDEKGNPIYEIINKSKILEKRATELSEEIYGILSEI